MLGIWQRKIVAGCLNLSFLHHSATFCSILQHELFTFLEDPAEIDITIDELMECRFPSGKQQKPWRDCNYRR